ncbi:hypothetical protein BDN70DRAFT_264046 [Pholiota conissans]|uniref:Uncharacterized protein n=1 Tax=Pholiota conissans TaxID=109636 RepID=A0A9P5ZBQ6_9AGAR|nr:hypothetical protein BDN70DRAFT_264046 [Pholiota conissans]
MYTLFEVSNASYFQYVQKILSSLWTFWNTTLIQSAHFSNYFSSSASNKNLLLAFYSFAGLSLYFLCYSLKSKSRQPALGIDAAQALSNVFTPTSVAWPLLFVKLFSRSSIKTSASSSRSSIELDICELLSRICDGEVELRDSRDLAMLFQQRLSIYAWDLKLVMNGCWIIKVAEWFAKQHFVESPLATTQRLSTQWPLACILRIASCSRPSFDLDFVPYHELRHEIRCIQDLHRPGNSTVIEFSCLGPGVRLMGADFLLCAVPFVTSNVNAHACKKRINRTSMPFFVQVHDVVGILTSRRALAVKSIINISWEYAETLYRLEKDLVNDRNLRTQHIEDVALAGWREDRLMLAWEAGLLTSKLLVRWRITFSE